MGRIGLDRAVGALPSSPILIIFLPVKSLTCKGLELGLVNSSLLTDSRRHHRWCPMDPSKLAKKKIERVDPDLIHELDNRYECIRRTFNKAELQTLLKFLDQLQFGSSLSVPPPSLQQKHQVCFLSAWLVMFIS